MLSLSLSLSSIIIKNDGLTFWDIDRILSPIVILVVYDALEYVKRS